MNSAENQKGESSQGVWASIKESLRGSEQDFTDGIHLFTRDPEIALVGIESLRIISYGYVFYAWGMVMMQAFNGAGDTVTPTWINFFCFWLFQIPLAWVLSIPLGFGPTGVFIAIAASYSLSAVVGVVMFRRGRWKQQRV